MLWKSSLLANAYSITDSYYSTQAILQDSNVSEKDKWKNIGASIAGAIGGTALGIYFGGFMPFTVPGVIIAAGIGYYVGSAIFSYVGGFVGGICYEIYQAYQFNNSINEIYSNSNINQNFIQY